MSEVFKWLSKPLVWKWKNKTFYKVHLINNNLRTNRGDNELGLR